VLGARIEHIGDGLEVVGGEGVLVGHGSVLLVRLIATCDVNGVADEGGVEAVEVARHLRALDDFQELDRYVVYVDDVGEWVGVVEYPHVGCALLFLAAAVGSELGFLLEASALSAYCPVKEMGAIGASECSDRVHICDRYMKLFSIIYIYTPTCVY
jgi:hypothetical protein